MKNLKNNKNKINNKKLKMFSKFIFFFFIISLIKFSKEPRNLQIQCSSGCSSCTSTTICTSCNPGYLLVGKYEGSSNDEVNCQQISSTSGYYKVSSTNIYYPCIENCVNCSNQITCQTCNIGYKLRYDGYKCEISIEGCKTIISNTECQECDDSHVFYKTSKDKCYKKYIFDNNRYYSLD